MPLLYARWNCMAIEMEISISQRLGNDVTDSDSDVSSTAERLRQ